MDMKRVWGARQVLRPGVVVDDEARDRVARGQTRQRVAGEPARVLQLLRVDDEVAAGVGGDEADHHLAREGPVLAADVAYLSHIHADPHFEPARNASDQILAAVDEPRDDRVTVRRPARLAHEKNAPA